MDEDQAGGPACHRFFRAGHSPAAKEHTVGLFGQLEEALAARGYFRPKEKTEVMTHNLRAS